MPPQLPPPTSAPCDVTAQASRECSPDIGRPSTLPHPFFTSSPTLDSPAVSSYGYGPSDEHRDWQVDYLRSSKSCTVQRDSKAKFKARDPVIAVCSKCRKEVRAKCPYDSTRFADHFMICKGRSQLRLDCFLKPVSPRKTEPIHRGRCACPGLTEAIRPGIVKYLGRTMAPGGGGEWIVTIAKREYGVTYSKLTVEEKDAVWSLQTEDRKSVV